jgi:hypothetical protein
MAYQNLENLDRSIQDVTRERKNLEEELRRVNESGPGNRFLFTLETMEPRLPEDEEEKAEKRDVWVDYKLNELIWSRGIENPPRKVRVKAIRFEDGLIEVSLPEE